MDSTLPVGSTGDRQDTLEHRPEAEKGDEVPTENVASAEGGCKPEWLLWTFKQVREHIEARIKAEARTFGKYTCVVADDIEPDIYDPGLIDGILDTQATTIVYGASGAGKTAAVVDMACSIAAGRAWRGHVTKQGVVLYFAAEQPSSTKRRIWAWKRHHEVDSLPLVAVQSPLLLSEQEVKDIVAAIEAIQKYFGQKVVLVVLDTLARTNPGDENSTQDMSAYVRAAEAVRDATGGHVMVVHHTGKDENRGARGSSALKAATDHELEVYRTEHGRGIALTKVREGESEGRTFGFELRKVPIGSNDVGREVTTVVAVPTEKAPKRPTESVEKEDYILSVLGGRTLSIRQLVDDLDLDRVSESEIVKNQRTVAYSIIRKMLVKGKLYGAEAAMRAGKKQ